MIRSDEIIGIFDLENTSISKATRGFLAEAEKQMEVINITDKLPKSFVVAQDRKTGKQRIYILQMSAATMYKRSGFLNRLAEQEPEDR
jgi:hypothetical protein